MNLLLDTQLVLWWMADDKRLSKATVVEVMRADNVYFSRASAWEVAIKSSLGKIRLDYEKFLAEIEIQGFQWLEIRNSHLVQVQQLPVYDDHRDPFDRLLVAQSLAEPLVLLTADSKLGRYGSTVHVVT